jgi:cyclic pyranopterin phosphate synthase
MFTEAGAAYPVASPMPPERSAGGPPVFSQKLPAPGPQDTLGRPLRDLRLSVTDRCNFRCTYCMPKEAFGADHAFLPKSAVLTFEEMTRLSRIFVQLGVEKIRLTGGEPLLRRNLPLLVAQLARIDGLRDLTLTTNGSALVNLARPLRDAGLKRLTVSLDALDDTIFRAMNDVDFPLERVLAGIDVALHAGFEPIKINMVVKRGVNDSQILPMVRHFRDPRFILRFIEFMDVGSTNGWRMDDVVPAAEIIARISRDFPLESLAPNYPGEVARRWRHRDGAGEIGVITSVTQPFCQGCTRARISAEGQLYTCLFASTGHDLRALLRSNADDTVIERVLRAVWSARSDRYSDLRTAATSARPKVEMSHIGG